VTVQEDMSNDKQDQPTTPRYITLSELARQTGISVRTFNRLRRAGKFPSGVFIKIGRATRVDFAAFVQWAAALKPGPIV